MKIKLNTDIMLQGQ